MLAGNQWEGEEKNQLSGRKKEPIVCTMKEEPFPLPNSERGKLTTAKGKSPAVNVCLSIYITLSVEKCKSTFVILV